LLGRIKQSWLESGSVYGYRKVPDNLKDFGERCGRNRVYRLMKQVLTVARAGGVGGVARRYASSYRM
jgi:hypothetical protein